MVKVFYFYKYYLKFRRLISWIWYQEPIKVGILVGGHCSLGIWVLLCLFFLLFKIALLTHSFCKINSRSVWTLWNSIPSSLFFDNFRFIVQQNEILKLFSILNGLDKRSSLVLTYWSNYRAYFVGLSHKFLDILFHRVYTWSVLLKTKFYFCKITHLIFGLLHLLG